jgi:glycosyltransferase involved in cell wall biosynthesis
MAEMNPEISVLITARNAADTIVQAVQSILDQTMRDIELLVYDDASEDQTAKLVESLSDRRIRLIRGREHKGIPAARNILLREAKGKFIAWLDADDIAFPQRLERQLDYFRNHPQTDMLFSWIEVRNAGIRAVRMPANGPLLTAWLMLRNPFAHSTLMARNFFAAEGISYDENFARAQDYELYLRLANEKVFSMLPEILVSYDARSGAAEQLALPFLPRLLKRNLQAAGIQAGPLEIEMFLHFLCSNSNIDISACLTTSRILDLLGNATWPVIADKTWKKQVLLRQWFRLFRLSKGSAKWKAFKKIFLAGPLQWWSLWSWRVRWD